MKTGIVTILHMGQARIGYTFRFIGSPTICKGCTHFTPCQSNLKVNRIYEVKEILKRQIPCGLHEGEGVVVSLKEILYEVNLPSKQCLQGALIQFVSQKCGETGCSEFDRCNPLALKEGDRCRVVSIGSSCSCLKGLNFSSVKLLRED